MITNEELDTHFVSPRMREYFRKKLPKIDQYELNIRIQELLKYLNMAVYSSGGIPFTSDIDEVWHLWILETQEYTALCEKLYGGRFMHHSSSEYLSLAQNDDGGGNGDFQRALEILMSYVLNYGDFERRRIRYWPVADLLYQHFNEDLRKTNDWLKMKIKQCSAMEEAV